MFIFYILYHRDGGGQFRGVWGCGAPPACPWEGPRGGRKPPRFSNNSFCVVSLCVSSGLPIMIIITNIPRPSADKSDGF